MPTFGELPAFFREPPPFSCQPEIPPNRPYRSKKNPTAASKASASNANPT